MADSFWNEVNGSLYESAIESLVHPTDSLIAWTHWETQLIIRFIICHFCWQKRTVLRLNNKNINFLCIETLYKISITFALELFGNKNSTDISQLYHIWYKYETKNSYRAIFALISWTLGVYNCILIGSISSELKCQVTYS